MGKPLRNILINLVKIKENKSGTIILETENYEDERGFFTEIYHKDKYSKVLSNINFVQDNYSFSKKSVLRGLHFQKNFPQGKLVRVLMGEIFDVAVDLRPDSKSYGHCDVITLSDVNNSQFWIPEGFAHGFVVLSEFAHVIYKCTNFYKPDDEKTLMWNDPDLNIDWPVSEPIVSDKDRNGVLLSKLSK
jgi:dTDP-4-dehydrorhamnose 3,5-epimerase